MLELPRIFMPKTALRDNYYRERRDINEEEYMSVKEHIEKMEYTLEVLRSIIEEMERISGQINLQIPPNHEV